MLFFPFSYLNKNSLISAVISLSIISFCEINLFCLKFWFGFQGFSLYLRAWMISIYWEWIYLLVILIFHDWWRYTSCTLSCFLVLLLNFFSFPLTDLFLAKHTLFLWLLSFPIIFLFYPGFAGFYLMLFFHQIYIYYSAYL